MLVLRRILLTRRTVLTQIGDKAAFPNRPRLGQGEQDMSLLRRKKSVEEAVAEAFRRPVKKRDRVRYTTVGRLRDAGFRVIWDGKGHPNHVSVEFGGFWDDHVGDAFDACFDK